MRRCIALLLSTSLALGVLAAGRADDERTQAPLEVYEWSIWVGSPSQTAVNALRASRDALPATVGTSRPKAEGKEHDAKFPVAPVSVVQFFGTPSRDIDIDVRVKQGLLLAHWPPGAERAGRVQWFKSDLNRAPTADARTPFLPDNHWLQALRKVDPALYHQRESRAERFLAYDTELHLPVPLRVRGGPDEYTLQNLTGARLLDVALIAPTETGYRVGWLDVLPSGVPDSVATSARAREDEAKKPKKPDRDRAQDVFDKTDATDKAPAKSKDKAKSDEAKPLPAEGSPDIRARVDQFLNRAITVNVESAPRRDLIGLVAGQARLRFELDEVTITKADVDLTKTTSLKAAGIAARDALADLLGSVGLSYRVTEDGTLFLTTAARLAEDSGKKNTVIEGPPVKLTLSQPLKASDPSYRELTRDSYARRLGRQGLRDEVVRTLLDQYANTLFAPGELIVLVHYPRDTIDEAVLLDVFPAPKTFVRTAALVLHGIDPRLQDRARELVKKLGDDSPKERETAESRLFDLGAVAVPALEDALRDKDIEIVFRAERLLLRLNRPVP